MADIDAVCVMFTVSGDPKIKHGTRPHDRTHIMNGSNRPFSEFSLLLFPHPLSANVDLNHERKMFLCLISAKGCHEAAHNT